MCKQANLLEWQVIKLIYLLKLNICKGGLHPARESAIIGNRRQKFLPEKANRLSAQKKARQIKKNRNEEKEYAG